MGESEEGVRYSSEVEAAIAAMFPSDDPLDRPDFDTVAYINSLFPNEQSLSSLDDTILRLQKKVRVLDEDIQSGIRSQTRAGNDGSQALHDAQSGMQDLLLRIRSIRDKAETSERMVQEITRDIKSLDHAKKHLTASITTLNHVHMLVGGVDLLNDMTERRQYKDAANLLAAVCNVLEHFENNKDVLQIQELSKRVEAIKRSLASQITLEFRTVFRKAEPDLQDTKAAQLLESCAVLDVLPPDAKEAVVDWFVALQMRDYPSTFAATSDQAWLDKVDRRYAWFKRMAGSYVEHCKDIFPQDWRMVEKLAQAFCKDTFGQLQRQILEHKAELDVKLLLFAVQKTTQFEQWLASKFKVALAEDELSEDEDEATMIAEEDRVLADGSEADKVRVKYLRQRREKEKEEKMRANPDKKIRKRGPSPFIGMISKVFEQCLDIYVVAQDSALDGLLEQWTRDFKSSLIFPENVTDEEAGTKVMQSAGDMFVFFKNSMKQCTSLSNKQPLFDLYLVFKKFLKLYAERILHSNLPKAATLSTILLKEGELRLSNQELFIVCSILNTADYCQDTTRQLQEKLAEMLDEKYSKQVDLNQEQDVFHELVSTSIAVLVRALESVCEPALTALTKQRWDNVEEVGDTSGYVSMIGKHITQTIPIVRTSLGASSKYFTNFNLKFVTAFVPKIIASLHKCKHISGVGAEQLLLDMQSLRQALLQLPTVGAPSLRKPGASYEKRVKDGMAGAEKILKALMTPHDIPALYVEDYIKLMGTDEGLSGLQRILEMKGLKRSEQQPILVAYRSQTSGAGGDAADAEGADGAASAAASGGGARGGASGAAAASAAAAASGNSPTKDKRGKKKGDGEGGGRKPNINIRKLESLMKRFQ